MKCRTVEIVEPLPPEVPASKTNAIDADDSDDEQMADDDAGVPAAAPAAAPPPPRRPRVLYVANNRYSVGENFPRRLTTGASKKADDDEEDGVAEQMSEYEMARKRRMDANEAFLKSLGF